MQLGDEMRAETIPGKLRHAWRALPKLEPLLASVAEGLGGGGGMEVEGGGEGGRVCVRPT